MKRFHRVNKYTLRAVGFSYAERGVSRRNQLPAGYKCDFMITNHFHCGKIYWSSSFLKQENRVVTEIKMRVLNNNKKFCQ